MKYNFDEIIPRENTNSVKYDLRKPVFGNPDVIPLWVADMDFKTPDFIVEAVKKRAEHEIYGYSTKPDSFFASIVQWMKKRHNWDIQSNWIAFSPGVVPALSLCVLAFTNPGDKIIVQSPVYHPFFSCIKNNGRQIVNNSLKEENGRYSFDLEGLEKIIDSRTKMIFISNPHNPVGRVWTNEELEKLAEICLKHEILILSDEIHSDLIFQPHKHIPIASISEEIANLSITTIAPSKTFNIAGLSTSALIIPNKKILSIYNNMLDTIHIGMGNIFGVAALESAYRNGEEWLEQLMNYLNENLNYLSDYFEKNLPKIKVIKPEGTYLVWLDFRELNLSQKELNQKLIQDAKVGLNDGTMFGEGGKGFQRMNIACQKATLEKAFINLKKHFS